MKRKNSRAMVEGAVYQGYAGLVLAVTTYKEQPNHNVIFHYDFHKLLGTVREFLDTSEDLQVAGQALLRIARDFDREVPNKGELTENALEQTFAALVPHFEASTGG